MSIGSILSGLTGTSHAAFSTRSATSSASAELQTLFAKLHMDAIASTATSATATTGTTSTGAASGGLIGEIGHGLRHLLDGGIAAAKDVRAAAKTATSAYAHGGALGTLASQVVDKLG